MIYTINPLRGLGAVRAIDSRVCAPDEEFCDDTCVNHYKQWALNNRAKAACLTNEQKHRLIDTCERIRAKTASPAEVSAAQAIMDDPCANQYAQQCAGAADDWARRNPVDAACLSPADMQHIEAMCLQFKQGSIGAKEASDHLDALVAAGCPVAPLQPEPAPPPPIAPPLAPPPVPAPNAVDVAIYDEPAVYTVPLDVFQKEEPTAFRKWGPIVGVLLIVGGGIYLLR